jgi:hypothetical protein
MRATVTHDRALEVRSLYAQSRDTLRALVSVAGWYRVADAPDGVRLYAPAPNEAGLPLEVAALTIVVECGAFLGRAQRVRDEAEQTCGELHPATVAPSPDAAESRRC